MSKESFYKGLYSAWKKNKHPDTSYSDFRNHSWMIYNSKGRTMSYDAWLTKAVETNMMAAEGETPVVVETPPIITPPVSKFAKYFWTGLLGVTILGGIWYFTKK